MELDVQMCYGIRLSKNDHLKLYERFKSAWNYTEFDKIKWCYQNINLNDGFEELMIIQMINGHCYLATDYYFVNDVHYKETDPIRMLGTEGDSKIKILISYLNLDNQKIGLHVFTFPKLTM